MKNKYEKYNNILSYRYGQLKHNGIWNIIMRTTKYARRYLFISRLIKYMSAIIAFIETSATLVVTATGIIIAIPCVLLSMMISWLFSSFKKRKYDPLISADIENADKLVFIDAPKGYYRKKNHYLKRMAKCFRDEGYTVFVVSGTNFSYLFTVARKADDRLWVIKLHFFFNIKKKYLKDKEDITTFIF